MDEEKYNLKYKISLEGKLNFRNSVNRGICMVWDVLFLPLTASLSKGQSQKERKQILGQPIGFKKSSNHLSFYKVIASYFSQSPHIKISVLCHKCQT